MCNIPAAPQTTALTIFCKGQLPSTIQEWQLTIDECLKKRLEGISGWVVVGWTNEKIRGWPGVGWSAIVPDIDRARR